MNFLLWQNSWNMVLFRFRCMAVASCTDFLPCWICKCDHLSWTTPIWETGVVEWSKFCIQSNLVKSIRRNCKESWKFMRFSLSQFPVKNLSMNWTTKVWNLNWTNVWFIQWFEFRFQLVYCVIMNLDFENLRIFRSDCFWCLKLSRKSPIES